MQSEPWESVTGFLAALWKGASTTYAFTRNRERVSGAAVCPGGAQGEGGAGCPHCSAAGSVSVTSGLPCSLWASGDGWGQSQLQERLPEAASGSLTRALLAPGAQRLPDE